MQGCKSGASVPLQQPRLEWPTRRGQGLDSLRCPLMRAFTLFPSPLSLGPDASGFDANTEFDLNKDYKFLTIDLNLYIYWMHCNSKISICLRGGISDTHSHTASSTTTSIQHDDALSF